MAVETVSEAITGLRKLRTASLLYIVANILGLVLLYTSLALGTKLIGVSPSGGSVESIELVKGFGSEIAILVIIIVTAIVTIILGLIAIYAYLIPAYKHLKNYDSVFSTPYMLMLIGYVGGVLLVFLGIIVTVVAVSLMGSVIMISIGIFVIALGGLLTLLGYIGELIGMFTLYSKFSEALFMIAGILLIISIVGTIITTIVGTIINIPSIVTLSYSAILWPIYMIFIILSIVAWIFMYFGTNKTLKIYSSQIETSSSQTTETIHISP